VNCTHSVYWYPIEGHLPLGLVPRGGQDPLAGSAGLDWRPERGSGEGPGEGPREAGFLGFPGFSGSPGFPGFSGI